MVVSPNRVFVLIEFVVSTGFGIYSLNIFAVSFEENFFNQSPQFAIIHFPSSHHCRQGTTSNPNITTQYPYPLTSIHNPIHP